MNSSTATWYRGRRVFVTGHTGFKGTWLTCWLQKAGAVVTGYSLAPAEPSLFCAVGLPSGMRSIIGDVQDRVALGRALEECAPEVVFHLAAQALVRRSYAQPVETFATNVMGTAHLLDAVRETDSVRSVVVVTSDKCYENQGILRAYAETDRMGGHDPYSSSKGCAELVTAAYHRSYFQGNSVFVASARAGNVIGGGDWSEDRLVPDLIRGALEQVPTLIRRPNAIRPWQHVLEPLWGYLLLARMLAEHGDDFRGPWNFGPLDGGSVPVREVVRRMSNTWDRVAAIYEQEPGGPHEDEALLLDISKATTLLGWQPVLTLDEAIELTVKWYRAFYEEGALARTLVNDQLHAYERRTGDLK